MSDKQQSQWNAEADAQAEAECQQAEAESSLAAPAGAASALHDIGVAVKEALTDYRCEYTRIIGEEGGMPLVDMLTPPFHDITLGQKELLLLEDEIMGKIADLLMPNAAPTTAKP